jgi:hypothetical protein
MNAIVRPPATTAVHNRSDTAAANFAAIEGTAERTAADAA